MSSRSDNSNSNYQQQQQNATTDPIHYFSAVRGDHNDVSQSDLRRLDSDDDEGVVGYGESTRNSSNMVISTPPASAFASAASAASAAAATAAAAAAAAAAPGAVVDTDLEKEMAHLRMMASDDNNNENNNNNNDDYYQPYKADVEEDGEEEEDDDGETTTDDDDGSAIIPPIPPPIPPPPPRSNRKLPITKQAYRPQSIGPPPLSSASSAAQPARERPELGQSWPYSATLSFTRNLIFYGSGSINTQEHILACQNLQTCRNLRTKYYGRLRGGGLHHHSGDDDDGGGTTTQNANSSSAATAVTERPPPPVDDSLLLQKSDQLTFRIGKEGVAEIYYKDDNTKKDDDVNNNKTNLVPVPTVSEFEHDYQQLVQLVTDGATRSFCFQRLQMLSTGYKMHLTMNSTIENIEQSNLLGNDFYRTMKIDNHIHAAAAPSAKQFVDFVRFKLQTEPNTIVCCTKTKDSNHEQRKTTLQQVYQNAGLDMDHLTIDAFNVLADYSVYQRFDNFNSKYSPFQKADMRRIFLKTTNCLDGRYFAELLKTTVLQRLEANKGHNSACEMRLSIYGMERHEWYDLSCWMLRNWDHPDYPGPVLSPDNRWIIQIPRLWRIYRHKHDNEQPSFQEMIENIFIPLFEATLYPEQHPEIANAMKHIVGFDSVDDEGAMEESSCSGCRPYEWTNPHNPSYWWQLYFLWSNLHVLNRLRKARNLNTFAFRPHAGETGDPMHLAAAYLLCDSINHGISLDAQVSLQYLYYLDQIGLSIAPLSNNFLFRKLADNPFPKFFRRGLNVTLSTDDPLLFHMSDDALLEEYSVARATYDLSMTDLMEIARNSVLQCGFEEEFKETWLGKDYRKGLTFCDENITHVPLIRAKFRAEHLAIEHMLVHLIAAKKGDKVLEEMKVQFGLARDAHRDVLFENFDDVPSFPERGQL